MEIDKILKYIKEDERGLLEKLKAFDSNDFNLQTQNLVKILLIMVERAEHPFEAHRFLYTTILRILPQILSSENIIKEFIALLKANSLARYQNASQVIREFIIGVEDRKFIDTEYDEIKINSEQLTAFKTELIKVNLFFLETAIKENYTHEEIMSIFYSCVDRLEAERRIIISDKALDLIRIYLNKSPQDYIHWFIRPLYSGGINSSHWEYFLHVAEPFYEQIFKGPKFTIEDFLKIARNASIEQALIDDVEGFCNALKARPPVDGNRRVLLKNPLTPNGFELKSKSHKGVRDEFKN